VGYPNRASRDGVNRFGNRLRRSSSRHNRIVASKAQAELFDVLDQFV
jgi:hypothetical protein